MRCSLSLKFGKDIAGLVNWWAWKLKLNNVINEYHSLFTSVTLRFRGKHKAVKFGDWFYFINSRHTDEEREYFYHWNCKTKNIDSINVQLPANYWHIKELY